MTTWKRNLQSRAALAVARATRIATGVPGNEKATLILPPAGPGSLGDEAMMEVCFERLKREGREFGIADFQKEDRWPGEPEGTHHLDLSGFISSSYLRSLRGVADELRRYERLWWLGADVVDGHYTEVGSLRRVDLARMAADLGLEVSVLGFSFNENPSPLVVRALQKLPASVRLCARDPVSHERLVARLGRPVELVADVAFGLEGPGELRPEEEELIERIRVKRRQGNVVLGLNVSHRAFKSTGHEDLHEAVMAYGSAVSALLRERQNVLVVGIPHDYRRSADEKSDLEMLTAIATAVDRDVRDRVVVPGFRLRSGFVRRLVAEVDAVFSGRMHLVIAALGEGTPAAGLSYQGKLTGLYRHFGLSELAVDPAEALAPSRALASFRKLLDEREALSKRIAESTQHVVALQRRNFEATTIPKQARRLLLVSPEPTHPTNKGNRARIADLCERAEGLGWEVHIAHVEQTAADRPAMRQHWGTRYHPIPYRYPLSARIKVARRLRGAITHDYELAIDDWYDVGVTAHLEALQRRYSFDAVMVEYAHQSKAFEAFDDEVVKILDTHDALAHRFAKQVAFGQRRAGFSTTPEEEAIAFSRADIVLAIQDLEQQEFQSRTKSEVVTVGHRVEVASDELSKPFERRILFLGSRNQANVDGISFFVDEVWPLISDAARLLVAGSICEVVEMPDGVEQMPVVDDVATVYRAADLVIVPIRFGTGLKIKAIEALGYGKPTVSTRVGAEGLEEAHGRAIMIADTPEDFARALRALLEDPAKRATVARSAIEFTHIWNDESEAAFASVLGRAAADQAAD